MLFGHGGFTMVGSAITAKKYRDHALKLRQVAKDMVDAGNRASLRSIADNYDRLARTIESAASKTPSRSTPTA